MTTSNEKVKNICDIATKHNFKWDFWMCRVEEQRLLAIYNDGLQTITPNDLANDDICHGIVVLCDKVYQDKDKMISIAIQACCCGNDKELGRLFDVAVKAHDFAFIQEILDEKHTKDATTLFPNINSFIKAVHLIHTKPYLKQEIIDLLCLAMKDDALNKNSFALLQTFASPCQLYSILKPIENITKDMQNVLLHLETLYCVKNYVKRHHAKFGNTSYSKYDENHKLAYDMHFVEDFPDATAVEKETLYEIICAEDSNFHATDADFNNKVIMRAFAKHHKYNDNHGHKYQLKAIALGDFDAFKEIKGSSYNDEIDDVLQAVISSKNKDFIVDCAKHVAKEWMMQYEVFGCEKRCKCAKQLYCSAIDLDSQDAIKEMEKICGSVELYHLLREKKSNVARYKCEDMQSHNLAVIIHLATMSVAGIFILIAIIMLFILLAQKVKVSFAGLLFMLVCAITSATISGIAYMV
jgi:hypothetical protein